MKREREDSFSLPKGQQGRLPPALARRITAEWVSSNAQCVFLDVGTGPGRLLLEVKKLLPEARVIGIDPLEFMVNIARQNIEKAGFSDIEVLPGSAENIPLDSGTVDLVLAQHSLLFWEDPQKGFSEIHRVLKLDGKVIIWDWNKSYPRWKFYLQNINLMRRAGWERAKDVRLSFQQAYKFEEALQLVRQGNFRLIEAEGKELRYFIKATKN